MGNRPIRAAGSWRHPRNGTHRSRAEARSGRSVMSDRPGRPRYAYRAGMATPEVTISIDDPRASDVRALVERHLEFARSHVPPGDIHALDLAGLLDPAVTMFTCRARGELLAVGALKRLDRRHAELKSMHTAQAARGRGIGRAMVAHLLDVARKRGFRRVSLKTGSQPAFAPARSLYASAGFTPCEPFSGYRPSRNSTFMTLSLDGRVTADRLRSSSAASVGTVTGALRAGSAVSPPPPARPGHRRVSGRSHRVNREVRPASG